MKKIDREKLLTYGLLDEELKHISKVANGLACNCICAKCGQRLVAKNNPNNKKLAHFAHHADIECDGAYETALHLLAKSILLKTKQLRLPDFHFDYDPTNSKSLFKEGCVVIFDEVIKDGQRVSIRNETIIPDSIGIIKKRRVFIEFAKTHFVDADKKAKIKNSGEACVEIDLSEQLLDENTLTAFLNSNSTEIYWICNPKMDNDYKIEVQKLLEQREKERIKEQEKLRNEKIEQERKKRAAFEKLKRYKSDSTLKIYRSDDGQVYKCPKKFEALNNLKSSRYYKQNNMLKSIIDGEFWNGEIYGYRPNGKWIFLKKEKVVVYPPDNVFQRLTEKDKRFANFFYAGLMQINAIQMMNIGTCRFCEFSVDFVSVEDKEYAICKHSTSNKQ